MDDQILHALHSARFFSHRSPQPQQSNSARTASPAATKPAPPKSAPADFSQEPFVIEQYLTTARFENDGTGERDLAVRIRVQSDAGVQQLGELVFGYNSANEEMDVRFVRVQEDRRHRRHRRSRRRERYDRQRRPRRSRYTRTTKKNTSPCPRSTPATPSNMKSSTRTVTPLAPGEFLVRLRFRQRRHRSRRTPGRQPSRRPRAQIHHPRPGSRAD